MKISVVIAAYNASATLGRAIQSVLNQTRPADEIIVVDDGSTDGTADTARQFGSRIRLISQPNGGASVARNTGIQNACGDWIAFLDADDEWLPEKLDKQCRFLLCQPELSWCYCSLIFNHPGRKRRDSAHPIQEFIPEGNRDGIVFEDYLAAYSQGFFVSTITVIIRREVFEKVGLFVPGMKRAQDNDLWFRIAYQYPRIGYVGRPLAIYHLDTPASSTKINVHYEFMIQFIERHLQLSTQSGRREAFMPCIRAMLEAWIRELCQDGHRREVQDLMNRFGEYVLPCFRREIRFRLAIPVIGSRVVDVYLWLKDHIKSLR